MIDGNPAIAHVDMDAFFARVEKKDHPELQNKPVIVGGLGPRGVVSTACYEARKYGVGSAMPMAEARHRCPAAEFIAPRLDRYRKLSKKIQSLCRNLTPDVKPVSLDEAYLDVRGVLHHYQSAEYLAESLRSRILEETGLTASVGMGPNKMMAKLASNQCKPDGKLVIHEDQREGFLRPLPVEVLPGVGPSTLKTMNTNEIKTVGDLQDLNLDELLDQFGERALIYKRKAHGKGKSTLDFGSETKSISHEETYSKNITDESTLLDRLHDLTNQVSRRLRREGYEARTIQLKERRGDFTTFTRQRTVSDPIRSTESIWKRVREIFNEEVELDSRGIRLQGVGLTNLRKQNVQGNLFDDTNRQHREQLNELVDEINRRMGEDSIFLAREMKD